MNFQPYKMANPDKLRVGMSVVEKESWANLRFKEF